MTEPTIPDAPLTPPARANTTPGAARLIQVVNIVLLLLIGGAVGFLYGRNYESNLRGITSRSGPAGQSLSQRAAAATGGGNQQVQMPVDHPPITGDMADGMAPVMQLRERLEQNPNDLEALIQLANLNYDIGRFQASIEYYQRAIALDPTNADVITDMGLAYRSDGKFDEALQAFDMAAAADATHWQCRLNRAIVLLMDRGDQAGALAAFEEYLALGPSTPHHAEVARQVEQLRRDAAQAGAGSPETPAAPHADAHEAGM